MVTKASDVAAFLGRRLVGDDIPIQQPTSLDNLQPYSISFATRYSTDLAKLGPAEKLVIIAASECEGQLRVTYILSEDPRLDFAKVLEEFFSPVSTESRIASTAIISPTATIGRSVTIGEFSVIEDDVKIGDGTRIGHHVVVRERCEIGERCVIKSGAVIGEDGFGYAFEKDGTPVRMPHIGRVILEDAVHVGVNSVVSRGTLDDTIVKAGTVISDLILIAHNATIERKAVIAGRICGSARIGERAWVAPQSVVRNKVYVGDYAMVGLGAVVAKSIEPGKVVVGNPARVLRERS